MVKGHIFINDLIHIQQMKNGMLRNIGLEPFAFEAADYIRIGQKETEEDRRRELSVVVTEKLKNMPSDELDRIVVDTNKFSSVLGNVVQLRGSEKEPVMDIVKEADEKNNVGGIAVDRLRSLIERIERLEEEKKQDTSADDGSDCNKSIKVRRRGRPSLTTQKSRVRQSVLQPQSLKKAIPDYKNGKVIFIDETTMRAETKSGFVRFEKVCPPKKRIISPALKRSKKVVKNVSGYHRSDALDGCVFRVLKYERQGGARYSIEEVRTGERYFRAFADKEKFLADILSLVKNY